MLSTNQSETKLYVIEWSHQIMTIQLKSSIQTILQICEAFKQH